VIGHCGSAHDSTVFRDSRTYQNSRNLFNENEWMWADSAYALDSWCITPYKKPHAALDENRTFNYYLSRVYISLAPSGTLLINFKQVRVKSEHAMGYLKGRFSSLRGLRQRIDGTTDHKRALAWVKSCIVIHTLISFVEQGDEDGEFVAELVREGTDAPGTSAGQADGGPPDTQRETQGQRKRTELKGVLFESLYT
jgi:DDE superfamily endonuclease